MFVLADDPFGNSDEPFGKSGFVAAAIPKPSPTPVVASIVPVTAKAAVATNPNAHRTDGFLMNGEMFYPDLAPSTNPYVPAPKATLKATPVAAVISARTDGILINGEMVRWLRTNFSIVSFVPSWCTFITY